MKRPSRGRVIVGGIVLLAQCLAATLVILTLVRFPVLPGRYMALVCALMGVLLLGTGYLVICLGKKRYIAGIVLSILLTVVYSFGFYTLEKLRSTVDNISGGDKEMILVDEMVVMVLADDPAQSVEDTLHYAYGIQNSFEYDNSLAVVEHINSTYTTTLDVHAYNNYSELAWALMDGEVQAMILDKSFVDLLWEYEEGFEDGTRILEVYSFEAELPQLSMTPTPTPTEAPTPTPDPNLSGTPTPTVTPLPTGRPKVEMPYRANSTDLTKNYFTVYCSGIDASGSINVRSRSDVNILMVVNPTTKKILLVTIPRDAYVTIPGISGGQYDKLTHAGIYGVKTSMNTLENVYGIDIDYYIRVNFTSVEKFVDILGGVNVYSAYEFTGRGTHFKKGYNYVNGAEALKFARERYAFAAGDNQRGKNQMELIKAVINKMMTPASLMKFGDIMNAVNGNFQTSLSMDQLTSLVRMQLDDGASWTFETYNVTVKGGSDYCYSYRGRKLYVGYINYDSVDAAVDKMLAVMEGR